MTHQPAGQKLPIFGPAFKITLFPSPEVILLQRPEPWMSLCQVWDIQGSFFFRVVTTGDKVGQNQLEFDDERIRKNPGEHRLSS